MANPWSLMGRAVSHVDVPFSWESSMQRWRGGGSCSCRTLALSIILHCLVEQIDVFICCWWTRQSARSFITSSARGALSAVRRRNGHWVNEAKTSKVGRECKQVSSEFPRWTMTCYCWDEVRPDCGLQWLDYIRVWFHTRDYAKLMLWKTMKCKIFGGGKQANAFLE